MARVRFATRPSAAAVLAVLALAFVGATVAGGARAPTPRSRMPHASSLQRCRGDVDAPARCATLDVPLRRAPHDARMLRLTFLRVAGRHADPGRVAFLLDGGPGYATSTPKSFFDGALGRDLAARENVVIVDQRGTGRSGALDCPRLQRTGVIPIAPALLDARVRDCARRVGPRADAFGSRAAADDLEAVRRALGARQVDIYGVSYGTLLARTFVARHPRSVRTVVLDGSFPVDLPPLLDDIWRASASLLRRACRWVGCGHDPVADLADVVRVSRARPLRARTGVGSGVRSAATVGPAQIAALLQGAGQSESSLVAELVAALHAARHGDPIPLVRAWADYRADARNPPPRYYSAGLAAATSCSDYRLAFDPRAGLRERHRQLAAAEARLPRRALGPFTPREWVRALGVAGPGLCLAWPAAGRPGPPIPAHARWPHVPTLVLQGDLDTATSAEQARRAVRGLPGARLVRFVAGTHDLLEHDEACVTPLIAAFIASGGAAPRVPRCARTGRPALDPVARFAPRARGLAAPAKRPGDTSTARARAHAAAVLLTLADALRHRGVGLRGGRIVAHGRCRTLSRVRVVEDVAVDGWVCLGHGRLEARVATAAVRLHVTGRLRRFRLRRPMALVGIDGHGGRIALTGDLG